MIDIDKIALEVAKEMDWKIARSEADLYAFAHKLLARVQEEAEPVAWLDPSRMYASCNKDGLQLGAQV